ncbi:MAG: metallophosphoesterase [Hyphomicrobiales bacterium]
MNRRDFIIKGIGFCMLCTLSLSSCKKLFEYSPLESDNGKHNDYLNDQHIEKIKDLTPKSDITSIAFIADNHKNMDEMKSIVNDINSKKDKIDFVVHLGDITDEGLSLGYTLGKEVLLDLQVPWFVVIGNHDCLANGYNIFKSFYGLTDYSFSYGEDKFIFFNSVVWELEGREPDFEWLESELKNTQDKRNRFVFSHIPPNGDQFTDKMDKKYDDLMKEYDVVASVHGHEHRYENNLDTVTGTRFIQVPATKSKSYVIIDVEDLELNVKHIEL